MGTSRKRKGNGKGYRAERLELVHSESEKQAATGTSRTKSFEADSLAPGNSFGPGKSYFAWCICTAPEKQRCFSRRPVRRTIAAPERKRLGLFSHVN